jgi:hypothetical protein
MHVVIIVPFFLWLSAEQTNSHMYRKQIASQPSIYVLDTPGVLVPSIPDMETGLKLALTGYVHAVFLCHQ